MPTDSIPRYGAVIGGKRVETADHIEIIDPSTGAPCAQVARGSAAEIDLAVEDARTAFATVWRATSAADRAAICRAMARLILDHAAELADLETTDTGKPISQAREDVRVTARYFEFYAAAEVMFGATLPTELGVLAFTLPEPHGVSAHIVPWNYPLQVSARTVAVALAAGNCCVLKPAEDAPLTPLRLGELALEAGFPPGVLNVVPGYGPEAGVALAAHPGIDHLSFTGSREVGQLVMASAAANIVPVTLELGGKSPQLVFPDFPATTVPAIVAAITEHAGQNCSAGSRLLVHESVHDEIVSAVARAFETIRIGPGCDDPDLGPLISARHRDRVLRYVELGKHIGTLVTGGDAPAHPRGGFFVRPTLFTDVPADSPVAQEEIFGPVLCVLRFTTLDEAVALANGTSYGLAAGVWTRDVYRIHRLVRDLVAGQIFVNNYSAAGGVELPFGGCRRSGFGREKGAAALQEYVRHKAVAIVSEQR